MKRPFPILTPLTPSRLNPLLRLLAVGLPLALSAANGGDGETSASPPFESFELVVQRNIFDPNRQASGPEQEREPPPPPPKTESLTLVGTLSYENRAFAFFDGSRPRHRTTLTKGDQIAEFEIVEIDFDSVLLANGGTNQVQLQVKHHLEKAGEGPWKPAGLVGASGSGGDDNRPGSGRSERASRESGDGAPGPSSDRGAPEGRGDETASSSREAILKKMMQRRQQELEQ